jgi:hypothetical protein
MIFTIKNKNFFNKSYRQYICKIFPLNIVIPGKYQSRNPEGSRTYKNYRFGWNQKDFAGIKP